MVREAALAVQDDQGPETGPPSEIALSQVNEPWKIERDRSLTVASVGRLIIRPAAPSSEWARIRITDRVKNESSIRGLEIRRWPAKEVIGNASPKGPG